MKGTFEHRANTALAHLQSQVERLEWAGHSEAAAILFARAVLQTGAGDPALSCAACQTALPDHIEAELNHQPGPYYRAMRRHLDLCADCADVYLDLLEIALLAEGGPLPRPALRVDLSFLEQSPRRIRLDA